MNRVSRMSLKGETGFQHALRQCSVVGPRMKTFMGGRVMMAHDGIRFIIAS